MYSSKSNESIKSFKRYGRWTRTHFNKHSLKFCSRYASKATCEMKKAIFDDTGLNCRKNSKS